MSLFFRRFQSSGPVKPTSTAAGLVDLLKQSYSDQDTGSKGSRASTKPPNSMPLVSPVTVRRAADFITLPPRTGVLAGRSISVPNYQRLDMSIRRLNYQNKINAVPQTVNLQRFAERPGKARLRIRIARKRREFNAGIRRLFDLVNEARRKGY